MLRFSKNLLTSTIREVIVEVTIEVCVEVTLEVTTILLPLGSLPAPLQ